MFGKTADSPTLGFLSKLIQARQIPNGSKRSEAGSDWEKGIDNQTA